MNTAPQRGSGLPRSYPRTYQTARDLVAIAVSSSYEERRALVLSAVRGRSPAEVRYLLHNPERIDVEGFSRGAPTGHRWLVEVAERDVDLLTAVLDADGPSPSPVLDGPVPGHRRSRPRGSVSRWRWARSGSSRRRWFSSCWWPRVPWCSILSFAEPPTVSGRVRRR